MSELRDVNTIDEAATYLGIEPAALVRLARLGKIGYLKSGRTLTFPRDVVQEYITRNTIPATPKNPHGLSSQSLQRVRKNVRSVA